MRAIWVSWDEYLAITVDTMWTQEEADEHKYCEAPIHNVDTRWILVVIHDDQTTQIQATCQSCMTVMAETLNTTPEEGAIELGPEDAEIARVIAAKIAEGKEYEE